MTDRAVSLDALAQPGSHATGTLAGMRSPLMQAATIRSRSAAITQWVEAGHSPWWTVQRDRIAHAARDVAALTLERFPNLKVPFHSRWRHFETQGQDRATGLLGLLARTHPAPDSRAVLLTKLDLCVVSVLLDAGSGPGWRFVDSAGHPHQRSEGLAVASIEAFIQGAFSSDAGQPLQADATGLESLTRARLSDWLQNRPDNPLEGLDGRLALMNRLGAALRERGDHRVADLYAPLLETASRGSGSQHPTISAAALLHQTVSALSSVWLKASEAPDGARGDLWPHPAATGPEPAGGSTQGWVPFHKLSQWLCYSLIEPLSEAGYTISNLDALSGLPEYRNGGLLVDTGVLLLRDTSLAGRTWTPADTLIIEWRALTVTLIDDLAHEVRLLLEQNGHDARSLPLACILEGGTWAAGRRHAERLRAGRPPLTVDTAGSLF